MLNSLQNLEWWHWWIVAAALAAIETFVPGVVAIWFAFAAVVVGTVLLLIPATPWPLQFVLFGLLGVVALVLWRWLRPAGADSSDQPTLNQRGVHYIGQVYTLVEPIILGTGKIKVGDSVWLAQGAADAPLGSKVRVVGVNGTVLQVESA